MPDQDSSRTSYGEALVSREFRALLSSQLIVVGGMSVAAVALTILVYRRTGSPLLSSLTFALSFFPYLLGGTLLSSVVDLVRPRKLVALCDCTSAVLVASMAAPGLPLPILFALLFTSGLLSSVSSGARAALTRATVSADAYVPARSLLRIAAQLAQIGGNAGGGALLLLLSPRGSLLVGAAAYACSALTIRVWLRDHATVGDASQTALLRDSLRGARTILGRQDLRRLLLVGWFGPLFIVAPEALAAPYVASHHASASMVGWWLVALPIGLIAGDVAGVRLLTAIQQRRIVAPAAAAGFLPFLVFAINPAIGVGMLLLVASGACGMYVLGLDARVRDATPPELFARTMTLNSSLMMALQGIGFTLAGAVAQAVGPARTIAIAGACGLTVTLVLLRGDFSRRRSPRRERLDRLRPL